MLDETELRSLLGYDVRDAEGKTLGNLERVFNDRGTGRPEWLGVFTGRFRHRHRLAPVEGAVREGNSIRVPFVKDKVESGPDYGTATTISDEMEREAYRHYGLEPASTA